MSKTLSLPSLRTNITALSLVQLSNYIIPMISLPYLTRVLGTEAFGKVAFAQVMMTYFVLLVDYGFSWSATRAVSAQRADRHAVSCIFTATWVAQWLLVALAALIATAVVLLSERLRSDAPLYAAAFSTVVGTALFPLWFLQGLERMQVVAALQLLSRILALPPLFIFIKQPQDAVWVPLIQGSGTLLGGAFALYWMQRESLITWQLPCWQDTLGALRDGGVLFGSRVAISVYTTLIPLVLGWVAGPVSLAYFNLADKLRSAAQSIMTPIFHAVYPRFCRSDEQNKRTLFRHSLIFITIISTGSGIFLYAFSEALVRLVGGPEFYPAKEPLKLLSILPVVVLSSSHVSINILIANGYYRAHLYSVIMGATIGILGLFLFVHNELDASIVLIISELVVCSLVFIFAYQLKSTKNK